MKCLSIILFLVLTFVESTDEPYIIISGKSIAVDGNTTIGEFSCSYNLKGKNDTLYLNQLAHKPYYFSLPVAAFQCGNPFLNKDFQKTLKAGEYPKIGVELKSLEINRYNEYTGELQLHLVGESKILKKVKFSNHQQGKSKFLLTVIDIKASEFGISPPKKFGGIMKADDNMQISVKLLLL